MAGDTMPGAGGSSPSNVTAKSPRPRKSSAQRTERLYNDALARRQRAAELKDESERAIRNNLEDCKRQAWMEQRERQRFYRFRDPRTHEEREDALLKRRQERKLSAYFEKVRNDEIEFEECTFQPRLYSRGQDAHLPPERSSSCGATSVIRGSQDRSRVQVFEYQADNPHRGSLMQKYLAQHQALIRSLTEIAAATETSGGDLHLYKQNLEVVHALERLDMQVLDLPQAQFNDLLARGYRLGLGEKGRRGLTSPRETQHVMAESPRNNLRQDFSTIAQYHEGGLR